MLKNTIPTIFDYLKDGFYSPYNYEMTLKIYLIYMFSSITLIVFLVMGIQCLLDTNTILGTILVCGSGLFILNMWYLKKTDDYKTSAFIMAYFLFILLLYLVIFGGVSHTGPLWSFVLPPIVLFIHGLKRGLVELIVYMLLISLLLFIKDGFFLETSYEYTFKVRVILIFSIILFLSSLYQYTREISMKRMHKMQTELEFFLKRDPLTGLFNRRGYDYNIKQIEDASYGAILMCDIDYFKNINDTYGHTAGDAVIKAVADIIRESIRDEDLSVRWGGEEFFIFLSRVTVDEAYIIAEKLRTKIEEIPIVYHDDNMYITISIGISVVKKDIPLAEAIKHADSAMYLSKSRGRNQTTRP